MKVEIRDCALELQPGQILRLCAASGTLVACAAGTLWMTQEGVLRDDFLRAGESARIGSTGVTLLEAVGGRAALLSLRAPHAAATAVAAMRVRTAL
ncbi:MAG TPA: DUF2917 domain-containing protein [Burkholderiales bacterium]